VGLRLVVLGMMGAYPFGGQTWLYLNWLSSLRRLGHDVWYVEDNRLWQYDPRIDSFTDSCDYAVRHVARSLERIGLEDRWIYRWADPPERCWGGTVAELRELFRSCDALLNVCAATVLHDDHMLAPTRVWVETDPVVAELKAAAGDELVRQQLLDAHELHATYGENYGAPDCPVPLHGLHFAKTRQPVDLELWPETFTPDARHFTTIANYRVDVHEVAYGGETYSWSKHHEWERFIDLPRHTSQSFELALKAEPAAMERMRASGWGVVAALPLTLELDGYEEFIRRSRGEFTVAKDQNIRMRSGWFSERDACYLASGKPVIAQDTAFVVPTGEGLFAVGDVEEAAAAIAEVNADYARHARAARRLAEEWFDGRAVVGRLLDDLGLG
jgi:hypothetical protein